MSEAIPTVEYRELQEWPGYRFGSDGSVWTCRIRGTGPIRYPGPWKQKKLQKGKRKDGHKAYLFTRLTRGQKQITVAVHVLILKSFVGPCPPGMECRHLNGDGYDARIENLAWGTKQENMEDRKRHGNASEAEKHPDSKLTNAQVKEIKSRLSESDGLLSIEFNVTKPTIWKIRHGYSWKSITETSL